MLPLLALLSTTYTSVDGLDISHKSEVIDIRFTDGVELRYQVYQPEAAHYSKEMIAKAVGLATVDSMFEIQKLMPLGRRCNPDNFLQIYEIDITALNDPSRFPEEFLGNPLENRGPLWGYYDPRPYEDKVDAIVVSDHGAEENYRIMTHEVAHYWYNTYCVGRYSAITSEEFATKIAGESSWP